MSWVRVPEFFDHDGALPGASWAWWPRLSPADFAKVAACVPGIDKLIKSAPASSTAKAVPGLSGLGNVGGLASVAGSFQKLGLSPDMAGKFVPVLTNFVGSTGGPQVASLLSGALK